MRETSEPQGHQEEPRSSDAAALAAAGDPPLRSPGRTLLIQFFLLPAMIVGACVGVFLLFGALVQEQRTPRQVLAEIRSGRADQRWHAAFELSKLLDDPASVRRDAGFAAELMRAFEAERADRDPRVRRFLALSLGKLGDPAPADLLARSLDDEDLDTRLYVLLALGAVGNSTHAAAILPQLRSSDPGMRKAAAYVLGNLGASTANGALHEALQDPVLEVRWNAALALLRLRDRAGIGLGLQLLKREYVSRAQGITPEQVDAALLTACAAVGEFGDPAARPDLERLRNQDPNPAVRQAAIQALAGLPAPGHKAGRPAPISDRKAATLPMAPHASMGLLRRLRPPCMPLDPLA